MFKEKNKIYYKCIEFSHYKFGRMEVLLGEGRILFSHNFFKKCLKVKNKELPNASDTYSERDSCVELFEVFEYIKYSKVDEKTRWEFEEWLADVIKDCSKLL